MQDIDSYLESPLKKGDLVKCKKNELSRNYKSL